MFNKKVLAIDIGSRNIKMVEGKYEGEKVIVTKEITVETPENCYSDGQINNFITMKKYIENIIREENINNKKVIFTSKSTSIINRIVEIPWVKGKEIDDLIKYEVEQYLSLDIEEYIIKHKIIDEFYRDEVKMMRASIAVYPKSVAKLYWDLLKELKLTPVALDLNSNSINKLFTSKSNIEINSKHYNTDDTIVVIDFGHKQIELNIISKGILEFTRILTGGGSYIDSNIANELGIDEKTAEDKKIKMCNLNLDTKLSEDYFEDIKENEIETVNNSVKLLLDRWNSEIHRMLEYFKNRNKDRDINKIYIYGGTSDLKGICRYMESAIEIPVEKIHNMSNILVENPSNNIEISRYLNAIGSMIRLK